MGELTPKAALTGGCRPGLLAMAAAILALGSGCTGTRFWKDDSDAKTPAPMPAGATTTPFSSPPRSSSFVQEMMLPGTAPGATAPHAVHSEIFDKFSNVPATQIVVGWRNWIDYLPDPTQNGKQGPGIAGQLFLFGRGALPANPDGTLTVDLYDETPRQPGQPGNVPERWSFDKEKLKLLRSTDERFGKCYVIFLPWPSYRPDVTHIRIAARFDVEGRTPLIAEETKLVISPSAPTTTSLARDSYVPGQVQSLMGLTGFNPSGSPLGSLTPSTVTSNPYNSVPLGVIGSSLNGAPKDSMSKPVTPDPPLPISRVPVMSVPPSAIPLPPGVAAPSGPSAADMTSPASGNRGLTPLGAPPGLSPFAFTVGQQ